MNLPLNLQYKDTINQVANLSHKDNIKLYLVGGFVRDWILKRKSEDIDFLVVGDAIAFAQKVAIHFNRKVVVYKNFRTASIHLLDLNLEFASARKESYVESSRNPTVSSATLMEDLSRRDFTINSIVISLNQENLGEIIDPFLGIEDIKKKRIITPFQANITFQDDPLRMMRAIRFACQLDYQLDESSKQGIKQQKERLSIVKIERVSDEFNKILMSDKPSIGLKLLFETGILHSIFPEAVSLYGVSEKNNISHKDNFFHTLSVLDNIASSTDNLWLRWAALLHDIGKPKTKRFSEKVGWTFHGHEHVGARMVPHIFKRFKLPLDNRMDFVIKMVALHLRPIALSTAPSTDSAIRRLLLEAGNDLESLFKLCNADITTKSNFRRNKYINNFKNLEKKVFSVEKRDKIRNWQPPISGDEIMQLLNLKPGKTVGVIKEKIKEAILDGEIPNDKENATAYMQKLWSELFETEP